MNKCKFFYSMNLHYDDIFPNYLKNDQIKIKISYKSCEISDSVRF